ncbi:hypothetical protein HHI36_007199 [Cryptolaemus montrouzieri]|uniref:Uncharacterized protein n=1 Tax=Cryptolaemus montrouzieri TaxID=559131 RepID=A0ABD2MP85_9CUCU
MLSTLSCPIAERGRGKYSYVRTEFFSISHGGVLMANRVDFSYAMAEFKQIWTEADLLVELKQPLFLNELSDDENESDHEAEEEIADTNEDPDYQPPKKSWM